MARMGRFNKSQARYASDQAKNVRQLIVGTKCANDKPSGKTRLAMDAVSICPGMRSVASSKFMKCFAPLRFSRDYNLMLLIPENVL